MSFATIETDMRVKMAMRPLLRRLAELETVLKQQTTRLRELEKRLSELEDSGGHEGE